MKILKIDSGKGYFYSFKVNDYQEVNTIDRDSLLLIVNYVLENGDCSKDDFNDDLIPNKAQKIVYKDLDTKIGELIDKRQSIIDEIDSKYKSAIEKYTNSLATNDVDNEESIDE